MEATDPSSSTHKPWFYERKGERLGGVSEEEIISLIQSGALSWGSAIWKQGFQDWTPIENTDLRIHLDTLSPPPLRGQQVNNTVVWILAFAPIIGFMLEAFVAGMVHADNPYKAESAAFNGQFWYITLILNVALSYFDEKRLSKSGTDTNRFSGMVWLVPVYLYQRAKALKHNLGYFGVWIACFVLVMLATVGY
jgi:hypothetical protein